MPAMTQKRSLSPTSHPSKLHRRLGCVTSQHASYTRPIAPPCIYALSLEQIKSIRWGMNIGIDMVMERAQTNLLNWKRVVLDLKEMNLTLDENEFERAGGDITWHRDTTIDFEIQAEGDNDEMLYEEKQSADMEDIAALFTHYDSLAASYPLIDPVEELPKFANQYTDSETGARFDANSEGGHEDPLAKLLTREVKSNEKVAWELIDIIQQWPQDKVDPRIEKEVREIKQGMAIINKIPKILPINKDEVPIVTREQVEEYARLHILALSVKEIKDLMNLHDWQDEEVRRWQAWIKSMTKQPTYSKPVNNHSQDEELISIKSPQAQRPILQLNPVLQMTQAEDSDLMRLPRQDPPLPNRDLNSIQAGDVQSHPITLDSSNDNVDKLVPLTDYGKRKIQPAKRYKLGIENTIKPNAVIGLSQVENEFAEQTVALNASSQEVDFPHGGNSQRPPTPYARMRDSSHEVKPLQQVSTYQSIGRTQGFHASQRKCTPDPRNILRPKAPLIGKVYEVSSSKVETTQLVKFTGRVDTAQSIGKSQPASPKFEYHPVFVAPEEHEFNAASQPGVYRFQGSGPPPARNRPRSYALSSSEAPEISVTDPFEGIYPPPIRMLDSGSDVMAKTPEQDASEIEKDVKTFRMALQARRKGLAAAAKVLINGGQLGVRTTLAAMKWKEQDGRLKADIQRRVQAYREMCFTSRKYEKGHVHLPGLGMEAQKHLPFLECDEAEKIRRTSTTKAMQDDFYMRLRAGLPDEEGGNLQLTEEQIAAYENFERETTQDFEAGLAEGLPTVAAAKKAAKKQADRQAALHDGIEDQIRKTQEARERAVELAMIKELRALNREAAETAGGKKAMKAQKKGKSRGKRHKK